MSTVFELVKRNIKMYFKDKGMFFTSLVTPIILLVLYATFLSNVYRDTFQAQMPEGLALPSGLLDGLVGGQLVSSLLAVSCITVAFCSNFLMVQDKVNGSIKDLKIAPVKSSTISISYYLATLVSTLLICLAATGVCLGYLAIVGWYMSFANVMLLILDVIVLVFFGTALSSLINMFLSTQGQLSAVGTIISAGYGFICGAYMPISSFGVGLQKVLSFLPGTYGTSLVRTHSLSGVFAEIEKLGVPSEVVSSMKNSLDCNIYFFDNYVNVPTMYLILGITTLVLVGVYLLIHILRRKTN